MHPLYSLSCQQPFSLVAENSPFAITRTIARFLADSARYLDLDTGGNKNWLQYNAFTRITHPQEPGENDP